ncbi:MAG: glycosyltransferase family 2 protein [Ignavibacteriae bacterium]|nr:glycosyltransferase family 2 protein [Ignavibacteria bacterium]MBI3364688.1 glycosyltransferase family 2 protein [Ignavibacteriota bacterium]
MDVSIIIVGYNSRELLKRCLASIIRETNGISYEIVLVDNASTDETRETIEQEFPTVRTIWNNQNRGYAAANNQGIAIAHGKYVVLLNPDTEVLDGAIQKIVEFADCHPRAGIVGCKLLFPDRTLQRSVKSFPTFTNVLWESTFLYRVFPRSPIFGRYYLSYFDCASELQVDWVSGACMMIRRQVLEKIGNLDEQFYMYAEEMDFCYRAKRAGFEVWYCPSAEVVHFWGGYSAINRRVVTWSLGSQMLYFQKHYTGAMLYLLIFVKYLGVAVRVFAYAIGGVVLINKKLLAKAYYFLYALYRLHTLRWKYHHNFTGRVTPWQPV